MNFYDLPQEKQIKLYDEYILYSENIFNHFNGKINPNNIVSSMSVLLTNLIHKDDRTYASYSQDGSLSVVLINILENIDWDDFNKANWLTKVLIIDSIIHELYHAEQDFSGDRVYDVDQLELEVEIAVCNYMTARQDEISFLINDTYGGKKYSKWILEQLNLPLDYDGIIRNIIKLSSDPIDRYASAASRLINIGLRNLINEMKMFNSIIFKLPSGYSFYLKSYGQLSNFENFIEVLYYIRGRYDWISWSKNLSRNTCTVYFSEEEANAKHACLLKAVEFQS